MSKQIDERIPREVGKGALPDHPAVKSPWDRLYSFHDCFHFAVRHNAGMGATFHDVLRILIPDYNTRVDRLGKCAYDMYQMIFSDKGKFNPYHKEVNNYIHPFCNGGWLSGGYGDSGDERLLMCGRLNDAGPFRCEKELDVCDWDIVGSEICRTSAHVMTSIGACYGNPSMEFQFYEGRGYGHLHCRAIGECREKYPLPKRELWEDPKIATEDMIKFTPREKMYKEPQFFREECGYETVNAFNKTETAADRYLTGGATLPLGTDYVQYVLADMVKKGEVDEKMVINTIECVFRSAGKNMFLDFYAKKGVRDWLGVPEGVEDGRVLGAYIEMVLQIILCDYKVVAFNKDEVIYDIDYAKLERHDSYLVTAYLALWYGMCRTLVNAEWFAWRETENVPDNIIRLKIGRKFDYRCL